MKMNFWEKSENVMFLHSLRLSFMPKIRKIYRAVFRENLVRQTERQRERERDRETERDGPEYKGPPDAIAKPIFNFSRSSSHRHRVHKKPQLK